MRKRLNYFKSNLNQWLLAVTLICNCFVLSGHAPVTHQARPQQSVQTELVYTPQSIVFKNIFTFYKTKPLQTHNLFYGSSIGLTDIIIARNHLLKVKLDNLSVRLNTVQICKHFYRIKIIPQSADEDIFSFVVG